MDIAQIAFGYYEVPKFKYEKSQQYFKVISSFCDVENIILEKVYLILGFKCDFVIGSGNNGNDIRKSKCWKCPVGVIILWAHTYLDIYQNN